MATYNSNKVNQPGQYPTMAWDEFGLPQQNFGSGAAGTSPPSTAEDQGSTNLPGQYPARDDFTGVPYSLGGAAGTGAPGSAGAPYDGTGGKDSVTYQLPTLYKGQRDEGSYDDPSGKMGYAQDTAQGNVNGKGDWTQANMAGYQADDRLQMPGVAGNTPAPGDQDRFQTDATPAGSSGHIMYGGFLNGRRT